MRSFVALIAVSLVALPALGQKAERGTIRGTVRSADDGAPLFGATVVVQWTVLGATTNAKGIFTARNVPPGTHTLIVSMVGYKREVVKNVTVHARDTAHMEVRLRGEPFEQAPVVVTASKHEESAQEVPVTVSVMKEKWLEQHNTVTLDEALRYMPGVVVTESQVSIRGSSGYSRGVGSRTLLLVDGVPMLAGDTGEIIWELIPVEGVDRVEVMKGAGSALYGSNALGGVINVITREPSTESRTFLRAYSGFYDSPYYREWKWSDYTQRFSGLSVGHARRIGNGSAFLSITRATSDGYRENDYYGRWIGFGYLKFNLDSYQSLSILGDGLWQHRGNYLFWRGLEQALRPPDDQLLQHVNATRWTIAPLYRYLAGEHLIINARLMVNRSHWDDDINNPGGIGNTSTATFVDGEVQANYSAPDSSLWILGGEFSRDMVSSNIFGDRNGSTIALYLQNERTTFSDVRLTLGLRADLIKQDQLATAGQVNPKIGLAYSPSEGSTALRFSAGRGFRSPSFGELFTTTSASGFRVVPNPDLKPERSWSFEVGANQQIPWLGVLDLALFDNEFWDLIEARFTRIQGSGGTEYAGRFDNVTRARTRGVEASVRTAPFNGLITADVSYTYLDAADVETGQPLKYRPRHVVTATLGIQHAWWEAGADFRHLSRVERVDEEFVQLGIVRNGDARVPIYVTDLRAAVHFSEFGIPCDVGVTVNNLFQYNYVELIGNLGPIRNFSAYVRAVL